MMVASVVVAVLFVSAVALSQDTSFISRLGWLPTAIIALTYLLVMLFSRWHFTAMPKRNSIKAQVEAIRKRLESEAVEAKTAKIDPDLITTTTQSINALLDQSDKTLEPDWSSAFVWSRGEELAALRLLHEAKRQLARLLPVERVRSRLLTAMPQLSKLDKDENAQLIKEIEKTLEVTPPDEKNLRSLLLESLGVIYFSRDSVSADVVSWNNRVMWLSMTGLLLAVFIAVLVPAMSLFVLLGALGGFLSRLTRTLTMETDPTNYEGYWILLFLSPVSGALAGWGGVLLIQFLIDFKFLGDIFTYNHGPNIETITEGRAYPLVLSASAFLLGFSERFFEQVVNFSTEKILPSSQENK
jgi:hypothetical protein